MDEICWRANAVKFSYNYSTSRSFQQDMVSFFHSFICMFIVISILNWMGMYRHETKSIYNNNIPNELLSCMCCAAV